jgi:hypothetical protein
MSIRDNKLNKRKCLFWLPVLEVLVHSGLALSLLAFSSKYITGTCGGLGHITAATKQGKRREGTGVSHSLWRALPKGSTTSQQCQVGDQVFNTQAFGEHARSDVQHRF